MTVCVHCGHPVHNPGARLWLHTNPDATHQNRGWTFCDSVPGVDDRSNRLTRATPKIESDAGTEQETLL